MKTLLRLGTALGLIVASLFIGFAFTPTIRMHVDNGGSPLTYGWLFLPMMVGALGIAVAALRDHQDQERPPEPAWGLYGHDAESRMFQTEVNMAPKPDEADPDAEFWRLANEATTWPTPPPRIPQPRRGQRVPVDPETVAEEAAFKRSQDGLGDE